MNIITFETVVKVYLDNIHTGNIVFIKDKGWQYQIKGTKLKGVFFDTLKECKESLL